MLIFDWNNCGYGHDEDVPYVFWHVLNSLYVLGGIPPDLQDIVQAILVRQNVVKDTPDKEKKFMEWLSMTIPHPYHTVTRIED